MTFRIGDQVRPSDYGRRYYNGTCDDRSPNGDTARRSLILGSVIEISREDERDLSVVVMPIETPSPHRGRMTYVAEALELIEHLIQEEP